MSMDRPFLHFQVKNRHITRIPPAPATSETNSSTLAQLHVHPEPSLDSLIALKYAELRNMESLDIPVEYLLSISK